MASPRSVAFFRTRAHDGIPSCRGFLSLPDRNTMDAIVQLKRRSLFETGAGYLVTGASGCVRTAPIPCEPRCLHVDGTRK